MTIVRGVNFQFTKLVVQTIQKCNFSTSRGQFQDTEIRASTRCLARCAHFLRHDSHSGVLTERHSSKVMIMKHHIYIFLFWARALLVLNREWFCQVNLCLQICNNEIPKNGRFSDHATLSNFYYLEQGLVEMETVKRVWDENCQTPCAIGITSLFCPQNKEKALTVTKLERPNWSNCRWSNG